MVKKLLIHVFIVRKNNVYIMYTYISHFLVQMCSKCTYTFYLVKNHTLCVVHLALHVFIILIMIRITLSRRVSLQLKIMVFL